MESGKTSKEEESTSPGQSVSFTVQQSTVPAQETPQIKEPAINNETPTENSAQENPSMDTAESENSDDFEYVSPQPKAEPKKVLSLFDKPEPKQEEVKQPDTQTINQSDYFEQIKAKALKRAHDRFEKLRHMRSVNQTPEEFKEKIEVPAYQRKKIKLQEVQHSSERSISKFNLNDDNEIISNNRFLHDNVD